MNKKYKRKDWYRLDKIQQRKTAYNLIIGERGNGKSYAVKEYIINNYYEKGSEFLYIRRCKHQKTRMNMQKVFADINDKIIEKNNESIYYTNDKGFFMSTDGKEGKTFGYVISIEEADKIKSIPLNKVKIIFFDEFLEYGNAIKNEESLFLSIISTVVRDRNDVEVYMCGNTVTKYSVYFSLFGIDLSKLKQGQIYTGNHKNGVTFSIEWCKSRNIVNGIKRGHSYLGFDNNPTSDMILYGEWEFDNVNISNVDGIGWECKRKLLPIYITANKEVFELSLYNHVNPIAFVRKINTQKGFVKEYIKYNLSYDKSIQLVNKNGIVPMYLKINSLIKNKVFNDDFNTFKLCVESGRIVFDTLESGSDFLKIFK